MEHYVAQQKARKKLPSYRQTAHKSGPLVAHADFDIDLCESSFWRKLISLQEVLTRVIFFGGKKVHADLFKTCLLNDRKFSWHGIKNKCEERVDTYQGILFTKWALEEFLTLPVNFSREMAAGIASKI